MRECWPWTAALRQDESCAFEHITVSQGSGCQGWISGGLWPPFGVGLSASLTQECVRVSKRRSDQPVGSTHPGEAS